MQRASREMARSFGEITSQLMQSPRFRHLSLQDLEWLAVPPLMTRQFRIIRGAMKDKTGKERAGLTFPVGLALWAMVSEQVDAKLTAQKADKAPFRLAPQEWKSGDIPWLLVLLTPPGAEAALAEKLSEMVADGKPMKHFVDLPPVKDKPKDGAEGGEDG